MSQSNNPYADQNFNSPGSPGSPGSPDGPNNSGGGGGFVKHLFWILPVGCLSMFLCCCGGFGGLMWFGYSLITNSQPYTQGINLAQQDPTVQSWLGTPIEPGLFTQADYRPDDVAVITLPLTGPKGSATLSVDADHDGSQWIYYELKVTNNATGESVDLRPALQAGGPANNSP